MILEAEMFVAKQYPLHAVRLDKTNMEAAALACGGTLFSYRTNKWAGEPYIRLATRHGHVKVRSGMWLLEQNGKWASLTDHNFHRKYELPKQRQIKIYTVTPGSVPTAVEKEIKEEKEIVLHQVNTMPPDVVKLSTFEQNLSEAKAQNEGDIEAQMAAARKVFGW